MNEIKAKVFIPITEAVEANEAMAKTYPIRNLVYGNSYKDIEEIPLTPNMDAATILLQYRECYNIADITETSMEDCGISEGEVIHCWSGLFADGSTALVNYVAGDCDEEGLYIYIEILNAEGESIACSDVYKSITDGNTYTFVYDNISYSVELAVRGSVK